MGTLRRFRFLALLAAAMTATVQTSAGAQTSAGERPGDDSPRATTAEVVFTQSWTHRITAGAAVSTSSPVLVDNGGDPFVAVAEMQGRLRAFDLDTGAPVPGWAGASTNFLTVAPLSSDGSNVYLPVAQDGHTRYPQYRKYGPAGNLVWNSNPTTNLATAGFMLSGMSLARPDGGAWELFAGSSSMQVHSVDAATGAANWSFFNADSTMATPAVADLYGTGRPQVVFSSDTTSSGLPGDRNGGILRVMTDDGRQICSATQFANGDVYKYSGYNNSTPAVTAVDGRPLIVFGSTGPVQTGPGANQLVAYDHACRLVWASAPLAGRADTAVSFADVTGTGRPSVLYVVGVRDGVNTYPRVYVLDPATGAVQRDSGTTLRPYGAMLAFTTSTSVTTADVNDDGAQDLFVPSRQGAFVVLDGASFTPLTTIDTNMVIQNTPIITTTDTGLRFTIAGYNGLGSQVSSYTVEQGRLGDLGWHHFGHDPQLTNTLGSLPGPTRDLLEGQSLAPGQSLRHAGHTLTVQHDGNVVLYDRTSAVRFQTNTAQPGSRLSLSLDGELMVLSPSDAVLWRSNTGLGGVERLVLGDDAVLRIQSGSWGPGRQLSRYTHLWSAPGPQPKVTGLWFGESLPAGRSLTSPSGSHRLVMQTDGNLVLYRTTGGAVWSSGTSHPSGRARLYFGQFGEMWIAVPNGPVLRDFRTGYKGADRLSVRDDGRLVVTAPTGAVLFDTAPPPPPRRVK